MHFHLIAAIAKDLSIGTCGQLPWRIPQDLARFKSMTDGHIVVMGRRTFQSLKKPLSNRLNIVLSSSFASKESYDNVIFVDSYIAMNNYLMNSVPDEYKNADVFVIGGASIYQYFLAGDLLTSVYITYVDKVYNSEVKFPAFGNYALKEHSHWLVDDVEKCRFCYLTYVREKESCEYNYLNVVEDILVNGCDRDDRTGVGTIGVFGRSMRFDLSDYTLPLLTTKFVGWKSILKELLWFLRGDTNSKNLEKDGVSIWKANSSRHFLDNRGLAHYQEGDIGPMYFFQVFHYGAEYKGCDADYSGSGYDQMAELLMNLKNDPWSRRHLLTTFNPAAVESSVLAPCHGVVIQFYVDKPKNGSKLQLSCHMYQRSQDTFLGSPYNIASYAMLTHIIAKKVDMLAKELIITTGDAHIYKNHIDQMKIQLERTPYPFPKIGLSDSIVNKEWHELSVDDFDVIGYLHHSPIKGDMAV